MKKSSLFLSSVIGRNCFEDNKLCFSVRKQDHKLQFTLESTKPVGYLAIGLGKNMEESDMIIAWKNTRNESIISDRAGMGHTSPKLMDLKSQLLTSNITTMNAGLNVSFERDVGLSSKFLLDLSNVSFIWAYSESKPETPDNVDSKIKRHDSKGSFTANLSNGEVSHAPKAPKRGMHVLTILHALGMLIGWLGLPPLAIFVARYGKSMGHNWFRIHVGLFLLSGLLILISMILIFYKAQWEFHISNHTIIGSMVFVLFFFQVVLGVVIDRLWDPKRLDTPIIDKIHWWLGRSLIILALSNIVIGLVMVKVDFLWWLFFSFLIISHTIAFILAELNISKFWHNNNDSNMNWPSKGFPKPLY